MRFLYHYSFLVEDWEKQQVSHFLKSMDTSSRLGRFISGERSYGTSWIGSSLDLIGPDTLKKRKICNFYRDSKERVYFGRVFTFLEKWIGNFARGGIPEYNLNWMPHFPTQRYYEPRCFVTGKDWIIQVLILEAHFFSRVRKIAKTTISFVMSACPSTRMEQLDSQ